MKILDPAFWRSLGGPLARTAVAAAAPSVALILANPFALTTWLQVCGVVLLAVILAVATALKGLPDTSGVWWEQALQRSARQAGQYVVAAAVGAVALSDLDWSKIGVGVLISAGTTFILAAASIVNPAAVPKLALVDDTSPEGTDGYTDAEPEAATEDDTSADETATEPVASS